MRRYWSVAWAIGRRTIVTTLRNPALLIPPLVAPLVFFAAFAGGLTALGRAPGFDFPAGYTSFMFVFILLQAAVFGGLFAGFSMARDFESGFGRRLMLAAAHRTAIVVGYVLFAVLRGLLTLGVVFVAGLLAGMRLEGSPLELAGMFALAVGFSAVGALWSGGIALRTRTIQAAPLMQIPMFLSLFLAPVFVPLALLTGWIHGVATVNPVTAILTAGRGLAAGQPERTWAAFGWLLALGVLLGVWAVRSLRRAEAAGA